ncbi:von Willebrand factor type A domain-containing protein [Arenimonas sp.]|uniref:vWA domain-containing protein n=1 Tax=Arenimonas sp. TaxID=1872635 RepID=UPI0035B291EB
MRQIAVTALALAIAAGCAHRADDGASHAADAREKAREEQSERATLESVQVTGSRMMAPPVAAAPAAPPVAYMPMPRPPVERNTENYAAFEDNGIRRTAEQPVSTFSIDVDTGSYSNVRRMLAQGRLPPRDAVRVEEMINYFDYGYPAPTDRRQPFRVSTELAPAPWDGKRVLMQVGLKGYEVAREQIPASNLVFLIDTSGSMNSPDKLPLLKESFRQLVPRLRAQDRVSIVVYAGSAGLVLPPTPGDRHGEILAALGQLEAGGSTNGGEGIDLAYAMARQGFVEGGVNRVILATDGDFNVGIFDPRALETKVEAGRKAGVALTTLGFGQGNYNDALAEKLADVGDGNHAYIDNLMEGRKVLVEEMGSTLLTIASDVKIQVEFNPAQVAEYRLIGYENRQLEREDFNNDQVDAGEIGAGHDVTALYELCLVGMGCESSDALRYAAPASPAAGSGEIAFLKLRYKQPGQSQSVLVEQPIRRQDLRRQAGESLRFAAAVAAYADLLRGGRNMAGFSWDQVEVLARGARGDDPWGYRGEFLQLVAQARSLAPGRDPTPSISQD